jgi:hypothetical protein
MLYIRPNLNLVGGKTTTTTVLQFAYLAIVPTLQYFLYSCCLLQPTNKRRSYLSLLDGRENIQQQPQPQQLQARLLLSHHCSFVRSSLVARRLRSTQDRLQSISILSSFITKTMGNSPSSRQRKEDFPGSALLDGATGALCGSIQDTHHDDINNNKTNQQSSSSLASTLLAQADALCISSPTNNTEKKTFHDDSDDDDDKDEVVMNPTSALFARALVNEVSVDRNPNTMTPAAMAEREKRLLKAQQAAARQQYQNNKNNNNTTSSKPVGAMGKPNLLGSIAHSIGIEDVPKPQQQQQQTRDTNNNKSRVVPPSSMQENRAQLKGDYLTTSSTKKKKHSITIGLSLSRRSSVGHADSVTRQTAFDFNELQDRAYKYVSSTDGWLAGGGEKGGPPGSHHSNGGDPPETNKNVVAPPMTSSTSTSTATKATPDTVHIPIIQIDADSSAAVDSIIAALARGEVFIPHMSVLPEALGVNGVSPPDLQVRFGCERNDDAPPDEWPNWSLEFMHNQLYEYFAGVGAVWTQRPFRMTVATNVRWKTVKHMNRYFSHAERVIDAWRERGSQYLDPQLTYIDGGATPEEVARPHGIYLMRDGGVPTNYFAPNFDPPYTTKMTRSLLLNVLSKSWDKNRREWSSEPVQRLVTPTMLVANLCGCTDPASGGFMASEVTNVAFGDIARKSSNNMNDTSVDVSATSPDADETVITARTDVVQTPPAAVAKSQPPPAAAAAAPSMDSMDKFMAEDLGDDLDLDDDDEVVKGRSPPTTEEIIKMSEASSDERKLRKKWSRDKPPTPEQMRFHSRSPSSNQQDLVAPSEPGTSVATTAVHTNTALLKEFREDLRRQELKKGSDEENVSPRSTGRSPIVSAGQTLFY